MLEGEESALLRTKATQLTNLEQKNYRYNHYWLLYQETQETSD